jgi:hypothetical protein
MNIKTKQVWKIGNNLFILVCSFICIMNDNREGKKYIMNQERGSGAILLHIYKFQFCDICLKTGSRLKLCISVFILNRKEHYNRNELLTWNLRNVHTELIWIGSHIWEYIPRSFFFVFVINPFILFHNAVIFLQSSGQCKIFCLCKFSYYALLQLQL